MVKKMNALQVPQPLLFWSCLILFVFVFDFSYVWLNPVNKDDTELFERFFLVVFCLGLYMKIKYVWGLYNYTFIWQIFQLTLVAMMDVIHYIIF